MKLLGALTLLLCAPVLALACETTAIPLNLVFARQQQGPQPVSVETSLAGDVLRAKFHVRTDTVF